MSRYCSYCGNSGHNRRTCPDLKNFIVQHPNSWAALREKESSVNPIKKCSYCGEVGHTRPTCKQIKSDLIYIKKYVSEFRRKFADYMARHGIIPGALVSKGKKVGLISQIPWNYIHPRYTSYCGISNFGVMFPGEEYNTYGHLPHDDSGNKWPEYYLNNSYYKNECFNIFPPPREISIDEVLNIAPKGWIEAEDIKEVPEKVRVGRRGGMKPTTRFNFFTDNKVPMSLRD